jgi:hypothetical protein
MTLYTFFKDGDKVVYGTAIYGGDYFFFSGFETPEEARKEILSQYKGIERIWFENALKGKWSKIQ